MRYPVTDLYHICYFDLLSFDKFFGYLRKVLKISKNKVSHGKKLVQSSKTKHCNLTRKFIVISYFVFRRQPPKKIRQMKAGGQKKFDGTRLQILCRLVFNVELVLTK